MNRKFSCVFWNVYKFIIQFASVSFSEIQFNFCVRAIDFIRIYIDLRNNEFAMNYLTFK